MKSYLDSEYYEEIRADGLKTFFNTLLFMPFTILGKLLRTIFRGLGVLLGLAALVPTFGRLSNRAYFIERVSLLAKDLADWVVFPFALSRFFLRCLFVRKQSV